jgi:hypothetical protein
VSQEFIDANPGIRFTVNQYGLQAPAPGLQFASPAVDATPLIGRANSCINAGDFARMLVFDLWTDQVDQRQVVYSTGPEGTRAHFVDFGFSFGGDIDPNYPLEFENGIPAPLCPDFDYDQLTRWATFEPMLSRIEQVTAQEIVQCAESFPDDWLTQKGVWSHYEHTEPEIQRSELMDVVQELFRSRLYIRGRLAHYVEWSGHFPNWLDTGGKADWGVYKFVKYPFTPGNGDTLEGTDLDLPF